MQAIRMEGADAVQVSAPTRDADVARGRNGPVALVIGAGVSGLTTALVLARRGWRVCVLADRFGAETVTTVAGAVWELPPSVCGRHHGQAVPARSADWAMTSYRRFAKLAADPNAGVSLRPAVFYFRHPVVDHVGERDKVLQLDRRVPGFVHDATLIHAHGVNRAIGLVDAYSYLAPTVDTDRYLPWLTDQATNAGVGIVRDSVSGSLVAQQGRLCSQFTADVIVNCIGLGARDLAADTTMDPHRGALLRMVNDGTTMRPITAVHAVANDTGTDTQDMIFIVPRGEDRLLIGGLVEPGAMGDRSQRG